MTSKENNFNCNLSESMCLKALANRIKKSETIAHKQQQSVRKRNKPVTLPKLKFMEDVK